MRIATPVLATLALISSTARAAWFDNAGNACTSLDACECSGACSAACGANDCVGGAITAACETCLVTASPDGCGDEWAACYPPDPPPTSSCTPGLPMCGSAPACGDGAEVPTCADQGLSRLSCMPCCYQIGSLAFDDSGCM